MDIDRRAFVAALLAGGLGATRLGPLPQYLEAFAPLSGATWDSATADLPAEVSSPHGEATVRYDDYGVPTIEAESDGALYYATGYVHAADRLFQMDLFRRRMSGTLAAAVGDSVVEDDVFHAKMDFRGAAEANWQALEATDAGDALAAYADGVNAYREDQPLPMEFSLLGYEPAEWTPVASMLIEKQIAWGLTGSFETLRRAAAAEAFDRDVATDLYPFRLDHDVPILRPSAEFAGRRGGTATRSAELGESESQFESEPESQSESDPESEFDPEFEAEPEREPAAPSPAFADWLSRFESPDGIGSNSWIVSGEHTDSGLPLLANDPHLTLLAPPVWYEMHQRLPEMAVSGVAFPGVPFVVIGENGTGAWGFTNANADVIDFYTYEIDGEQYRYGDEWREFDVERRTIEVADGEDREVTVRKTVHGPLVERHGERVGVAWTGFMGSRTSEAVYELDRSDGLADARAALAKFDQPTQSAVYASRDGDTHFTVTGLIPRRTTDGEFVPGDRVFDGSAMEGEWVGYEPYGLPDLENGNWIPDGDTPQATNLDYLATANQRIVDDDVIDYYLAESYSAPWRARRIHDRLDERANADEPFTQEFVRDLQRDVYDERAALFVPTVLAARSEMDDDARALADELDGWDYRMDRDSRAALVFDRFVPHYKEVVYGTAMEDAGLGGSLPSDWVLLHLPADSDWFTGDLGPEQRSREDAIAAAMARTADELASEGWQTYGDFNVTDVEHPFDQSFLNYPHLPTDGSPATVRNFRKLSDAGSSYRLLSRFDGEPSLSIVPGGNSGEYFSEHYRDQLELWADGEYTELTATTDGDPEISFAAGDGGGDGGDGGDGDA